MRKKWLWSLALPVLLVVAIFVARDISWKKLEARFHLVVHEWLKNETANTTVRGYGEGADNAIVYFDESADSLLTIDQMKLVPSRSPRPEDDSLIFISMDPGDSIGNRYGFYLSSKEDRGWIEFPGKENGSWKENVWGNFELAPETCHALKQRIEELRKHDGMNR